MTPFMYGSTSKAFLGFSCLSTAVPLLLPLPLLLIYPAVSPPSKPTQDNHNSSGQLSPSLFLFSSFTHPWSESVHGAFLRYGELGVIVLLVNMLEQLILILFSDDHPVSSTYLPQNFGWFRISEVNSFAFSFTVRVKRILNNISNYLKWWNCSTPIQKM